jgi:hypothetical protein
LTVHVRPLRTKSGRGFCCAEVRCNRASPVGAPFLSFWPAPRGFKPLVARVLRKAASKGVQQFDDREYHYSTGVSCSYFAPAAGLLGKCISASPEIINHILPGG